MKLQRRGRRVGGGWKALCDGCAALALEVFGSVGAQAGGAVGLPALVRLRGAGESRVLRAKA